MFRSSCLLFCLCWCALGAADHLFIRNQPAPDPGIEEPYRRYELVLQDVFTDGKLEEDHVNHLYLTLCREDGRWIQAWLTALTPNAPDLVRNVSDLQATSQGLAGTVVCDVFGVGRMTIALDVGVNGERLSGSYHSTWLRDDRRNPKAEGQVVGQVLDAEQLAEREAFAPGASWPCWRGPEGSGAAADSGQPMVERVRDARLVWQSEAMIPPGYYEGRRRGVAYNNYTKNQCGFCGPVLADGRLYLHYWEPAGEVVARKQVQMAEANAKEEKSSYSNFNHQPRELWYERFRVAADEIIVCIDATSGQTLWERRFPEAGLNIHNEGAGKNPYKGTKSSAFNQACVAYGKVLAVGTTGRIFCVDAVSGEPVWTADVGPFHQHMAKTKADWLAQEKIENISMICSSPSFADGVFAVPDGRGGLLGFDAESGRQLWGPIDGVVRGTNGRGGGAQSPIRWSTGSAEFFICAYGERVVCIEPRSGRILWTIDDALVGQGMASVSGNSLVVGGRRGKRDDGRGMQCWTISPTGAQKRWELPFKYGSYSYSTPVIYRDRVYGRCSTGQKGQNTYFVCVDLASGEVLAETGKTRKDNAAPCFAADGRFYCAALYQSMDTDPEHFADLSDGWNAAPCSPCEPYGGADGRIFLRGHDGIFCYDLRAADSGPNSTSGSP